MYIYIYIYIYIYVCVCVCVYTCYFKIFTQNVFLWKVNEGNITILEKRVVNVWTGLGWLRIE
jgi:hypothetical protein